MCYTRSITYNEWWTRISLSLSYGLNTLVVISTHSYHSYIDVSITHSYLSKILLSYFLTACSKLCNSTGRSRLRSLSACIWVNLCIEYKYIYISVRCKYVVKTAVTDIVSPTVSTEDPLALLSGKVSISYDVVFLLSLYTASWKCLNHSSCCLSILAWVLSCIKILLNNFLSISIYLIHKLLSTVNNSHSKSLCSKCHTVAILSIILEKWVSPGRTSTSLVNCIWVSRWRTAPDWRTTCCICNKHSITEHLSNKLSIRSLTTTCTSTRELKVRLSELTSLWCNCIELSKYIFVKLKCSTVIETLLFYHLCIKRWKWKCLISFNLRADIYTRTAACTVKYGNSNCKLLTRHTLHIYHLHRLRSLSCLFLIHNSRTNCCMRTYIRAKVTLQAGILIPNRNFNCYTSLLVSCRT